MRWHPLIYLASLVGAGITVIGIFYLVNPALLKSLLANISVLNPSGLELTIGEVEPFLFPDGAFSLSLAWANFTTGFFFSLIALGILGYQVLKNGEPDKTILVVWSLSILVMTMGQRRFAYYYAVNVALLTAILAWMVLKKAGLKEVFENSTALIMNKGKRVVKASAGLVRKKAWMGLAVLGVLSLVFIPNLAPAVKTVSQLPYAPDDAWTEALTWLKNNSPPPFENHDLYYQLVEKTNSGLCYDYPDSTYGVMAWWDYGHWITRIAHRLPNHAPGGGRSAKVAQCFLSQDEPTAGQITEALNSMYLMVDFPTVTTKFRAVCTWADVSRDKYFDTYYQQNNGNLQSLTLFYPEYYQTLLVRLYSFEGAEITPEVCTVISYQEKTDDSGKKFKEITRAWQFGSYPEAEAFMVRQPSGNFRVVSNDPFVSPVPLVTLKNYRLVYRSVSLSGPSHPSQPTPVKVFIYLGDRGQTKSVCQEVP